MNIRYLTIAFIIILILIVFIVAFMGIVLKDSAPTSTKAASSTVQETGTMENTATMSYSIPANAIPASQELEDSAKKAEDRRAAYEELCAQIEKERLKRKAEQKIEQQKLPKVPDEKNPSAVPQDKNVVLPTIEERKEMESKGVISF